MWPSPVTGQRVLALASTNASAVKLDPGSTWTGERPHQPIETGIGEDLVRVWGEHSQAHRKVSILTRVGSTWRAA